MKKRLKAFLDAILVLLYVVLIECIVTAGLAAMYGLFVGLRKAVANKGTPPDPQTVVDSIHKALMGDSLYLLMPIGILVCGVVFFFWYRDEIKGEVRGRVKEIFTANNTLMLLFIGLGFSYFVSGLLGITQNLFAKLFADYETGMNHVTSGNIYVVALLVIFIAPITEELIFRGVMLHRANRYLSFIGANILQAILFGICHGNIIQGTYATLIGLILGAVYYKFRSILPCIMIHMVVNSTGFFGALFPDNAIGICLCLLSGGVTLFYTLNMLKKTDQLVSEDVNAEHLMNGLAEGNNHSEENSKTGTWDNYSNS